MRSTDKISSYFFCNKLSVIAVIVSGLAFNIFNSFVPLLQGNMINLFVAKAPVKAIFTAVGYYIGLVIFVQLNRYWKRNAVRIFANKITVSMRKVSFQNLMKMDTNSSVGVDTGAILNKNITDISDTAEGIRKVTTEIFDSFILMVSYFGVLFSLNAFLASVALIFTVFSAIFSLATQKIIYRKVNRSKEESSVMQNFNLNMIKNNLQLLATGGEENYNRLYYEGQERLKNYSMSASVWQELRAPIAKVIASVSLLFTGYFGGKMVVDGTWQIGTFSAFLTALIAVTVKASKLSAMFNAYNKAKVSWARCKPMLRENKMPIEFKGSFGEGILECVDATFGFDAFVLKNVNLRLNSGVYAVTGKVHSGKSTFLSMLSGAQKYSGSVKICQTEAYSEDTSYSDRISYATQQGEIFCDTVANNITLGRTGDLSRAIIDSCLTDIERDKMLSHTLEGGVSGGQKSRIKLARAIFNAPPLILLDDSLSGLEPKMAKEIINNLKKYSDSVILIATNQEELIEIIENKITVADGEVKYERR